MLGMRGAVAPDAGLMETRCARSRACWTTPASADVPVGVDIVEPPFLFEMQQQGLHGRRRPAAHAGRPGDQVHDEIMLLNQAAAMVDGVYQDIVEALKPGIRENEIVALANKRLYEMGSDYVEAINAISGERCNPHPHNFTDRLIRPGRPGVLRHHPLVQRATGPATTARSASAARRRASATPTRKAREWMDAAIDADQARRRHRRDRRGLAQGRRSSASPTRWRRSACSSATASVSACTSGRSSRG